MRPSHLQSGGHAGESEARVLEIEHRLAESFPVLGEGNRLVDRALRAALRGDGDRKPFLRQLAHQIFETPAFLAKTVRDRNTHIGKEQFGGVGGVLADLVEIAATGKALPLGFHKDEGDSIGAARWIGLGDGDDQIGMLAVGDIGLGAIDDVVVAVAPRGGLDVFEVRSGARLGHGDGNDRLAADHARQPGTLLFLRAVMHDVGNCDIGLQR